MTVREDLAAAASTVEGITVTPYFRQTTTTGQGCVRLDHTDYPDSLGGWDTWQIVVFMPQDTAVAEKYLEAKRGPLRDALAAHMIVRRITAGQLAIDTGTVPVVFIEGQREEED